jgi:hypothetical protein
VRVPGGGVNSVDDASTRVSDSYEQRRRCESWCRVRDRSRSTGSDEVELCVHRIVLAPAAQTHPHRTDVGSGSPRGSPRGKNLLRDRDAGFRIESDGSLEFLLGCRVNPQPLHLLRSCASIRRRTSSQCEAQSISPWRFSRQRSMSPFAPSLMGRAKLASETLPGEVTCQHHGAAIHQPPHAAHQLCFTASAALQVLH